MQNSNVNWDDETVEIHLTYEELQTLTMIDDACRIARTATSYEYRDLEGKVCLAGDWGLYCTIVNTLLQPGNEGMLSHETYSSSEAH